MTQEDKERETGCQMIVNHRDCANGRTKTPKLCGQPFPCPDHKLVMISKPAGALSAWRYEPR